MPDFLGLIQSSFRLSRMFDRDGAGARMGDFTQDDGENCWYRKKKVKSLPKGLAYPMVYDRVLVLRIDRPQRSVPGKQAVACSL